MTLLPHRARTFAALLALLIGFAYSGTARGQSIFIPFGATWSYLDDGSEQGSAWTQPGFDASSWQSGPAELGYGESEATRVGFGGNGAKKFITTYFRHSFTLPDPSTLPGIKIELLRDDGAVMYINGQEIGRSNMPEGPIDKDTRASISQGGNLENILYEFVVSPALLSAGENTIAVEVHQDTPGSSDLSFDLRATDAVGPTAPAIKNCLLAVRQDDPVIAITAENLRATDFTNDATELDLRISGLESGRFELVTDPGISITQFTQAQVDSGDIQFVYAAWRFGAGTNAGNLAEHTRFREISGLVASIQTPEVLWAIEDSDNPATLIALGVDGSNRGEWTLTGATNTDWEDIAAATIDDQPLLYVGDFGDNDAVRTSLSILRLREPLLADDNGGIIPATEIETIEIQYPETPAGETGVGGVGIPARRDAESMIVDPHNGDIYILSKREPTGRLFRLAHQASYTGVQTLEYLGEMPAIINDSARGFTSSSTGADISRDGLEIVLRNYAHVLYFHRPDLNTSIADLLTGGAVEELSFVGLENEPVGEAICFSPGADAYFTIGEISSGVSAIPLFRYRRLPPNSPPAFAVAVSDGLLEDGPHQATVLFNAQPLEIWRHHNFSDLELADQDLEASLWGDLADADWDGLANLIEYALGTDPRSPQGDDDGGITVGWGEGSLTLSYKKFLDKTDIIYQVQSSADLKQWSDVPDEVIETGPGFELRRAAVGPMAGIDQYLRLKITR